jgi:hypothetical protein
MPALSRQQAALLDACTQPPACALHAHDARLTAVGSALFERSVSWLGAFAVTKAQRSPSAKASGQTIT